MSHVDVIDSRALLAKLRQAVRNAQLRTLTFAVKDQVQRIKAGVKPDGTPQQANEANTPYAKKKGNTPPLVGIRGQRQLSVESAYLIDTQKLTASIPTTRDGKIAERLRDLGYEFLGPGVEPSRAVVEYFEEQIKKETAVVDVDASTVRIEAGDAGGIFG